MNTLQGGDWVGKGADAFYAEMNTAVLPAMKRLVAALNEAASTTTKISRIMKRAEDEAAALFRLEGSGPDSLTTAPQMQTLASGAMMAFVPMASPGGGGGGSASDKPGKAQPDKKNDKPTGGGNSKSTDADLKAKDKVMDGLRKLDAEVGAELKALMGHVENRLKKARQIARLKGTPEYAARRAEFAKVEEKGLSVIARRIEQANALAEAAEARYEAARKSPKPPDDVELYDLELRAQYAAMRAKRMQEYQKYYFENRPELPR